MGAGLIISAIGALIGMVIGSYNTGMDYQEEQNEILQAQQDLEEEYNGRKDQLDNRYKAAKEEAGLEAGKKELQAQLLDDELTVYDTIDNVATGPVRTRINDILGAFMFGGEANQKKVKVLSGGEKVRCVLAKLMLEGANCLIFDEPTSHLDLEAIQSLNNGLIDFTGVCMFISHDHQFVDSIANRIIEFKKIY